MKIEFPSFEDQVRLETRLTLEEFRYAFNLLNDEVFGARLLLPEIKISPECDQEAYCTAECDIQPSGSYCHFEFVNRSPCIQWAIMILAHEMCHQYQWDIIGEHRTVHESKPRLLSHGPSFFIKRPELAKLGIPLKRQYSRKKVFDRQDIKFA